MELLSRSQSHRMLDDLGKEWKLNPLGHLEKTFMTNDFSDSLAFAGRIGILADQEGHHPDLTVRYGQLRVEIWTHQVDGLTENDFRLAAKIIA